MTPMRLGPATGFAVAGLLLVSACANDGSSATATTAATTPATTSPTTIDPAKVKADVTTAYKAILDHAAGDLTYLEEGEALRAAADGLRSTPAATAATVAIKDVTPLDQAGCTTAGVTSPCAKVTFDLLVNGATVVPDQTGYAVHDGGRWKLAKTTFCSLASLTGSTPAAC